MKPLLWVCACPLILMNCLNIFGQAGFKGVLQNAQDYHPVAMANVLLMDRKDSSLIRGTTTDNTGYFEIPVQAGGSYFLHLSSAGFRDSFFLPPPVTGNGLTDLGNLLLLPVQNQLKGVTVVAKKPLFEQRIDRLVINVKASPTNVGNTVLEVLEKSPGIMVDRSKPAVSMFGKDGVNVMINGKMNYMPQDAILQLLASLNAASVEKIELITVPPSKYDAGGNAGYINIVLSENPDQGLNWNYNVGMGVGQGTFPTAGLNFNFRDKRVNVFGTYSYSRQAQEQVINSYRIIKKENVINEVTIENYRDPYQRNHNLRVGMDYEASKKTVVGIILSGFNQKWGLDATSQSYYKTNGQTDTALMIDISEINHWKNLAGNINLQHTIKEGSVFSLNADYFYYINENPTSYQNAYYNGMHQLLGTEATFSGKNTEFSLYVANADYSARLNARASMEAGIKYFAASFANDVLVARNEQGTWIENPDLSGNFHLDESIMAAYVSFNQAVWKNTNLQAGLRYEYTQTNLGSQKQSNIVDRQYGNLFPTVYISQKLEHEQTLNISYNKRITRPSYKALAPFIYFVDPKTLISGNVALQPSITDAVKIDYVIKRFVFSAGYSYERFSIAQFLPETDTINNSQLIVARNLDYTSQYTLALALPFRITPWWYSTINITGNYMTLKGTINKIEKEFSQAYCNLNGSQIFSLPNYFTIEVKGEYTSKSIFWGSIWEPYAKLDIAIQKKFQKAGGTLTLGIDNMLDTYVWNNYLKIPEAGIETGGTIDFFPTTFKIGWTQHFGNNSLKASRERKSGDDARKRVEE